MAGPGTPSDGELLFRVSRGDEPAYRMLHDRHQTPVFRLSLVLMGTSGEAEEVAATAFFELWRKRDKVRVVGGSVLPWLLATTSSAAKNSVRSRRRFQRQIDRIRRHGDVPDHADEVARAMASLKISTRVRDVLQRLNAREASAVVLCVVHELPPAEAAVVLGVPEATVTSRLSRATARVRGDLRGSELRSGEATA